MTPDRFRDVLAELHWSQRGLADILARDERQVRRWASGQYPVPDDVAAWLEKLATFHAASPPPGKPDAAE